MGKGHQFGQISGKRNGIGKVLGTGVSQGCMLDVEGGWLMDGRKGELPQAGVGRTGTAGDGAVVCG